MDINRGRGNAVRILGRLLEILMDRLPLAVADMQGGSKRNAIPREASATVVLDAGREGSSGRSPRPWKARSDPNSAVSIQA